MQKILVIIATSYSNLLRFNEALDFAFIASAYNLNCTIYFKNSDILNVLNQPEDLTFKKIVSAPLYDITTLSFDLELKEKIKHIDLGKTLSSIVSFIEDENAFKNQFETIILFS